MNIIYSIKRRSLHLNKTIACKWNDTACKLEKYSILIKVIAHKQENIKCNAKNFAHK